MKTMKYLTTAALLLAAISVTAETWTSIVGSKIEAEFVKTERGIVYLKTADGKVRKIKMADLSKEDQQKAKQLASPFKGTKADEKKAAPKADKAMYELFGKELRNRKKEKVSVDTLHGKVVGIYFSAHWCGPCRAFTPKLVDFHKDMVQDDKPFEIIFVSSDKSEDAMYDYMKENKMPWLAVPYDSKLKGALSSKYGVSGIPMLVIIDEKGKIITKNGRGAISSDGEDAYDDWK